MDEQTDWMYDFMRKEANRLKSFQMNPPWPKEYVDIKKLAKAGFFYGFHADKVHCAFCRGQVCRWDRDDDPMAEHARHFTTCPFIMGGDVGNEPLGEDPFPGPKRPRPYDVCGAHTNCPTNSGSVVRSIIETASRPVSNYNLIYQQHHGVPDNNHPLHHHNGRFNYFGSDLEPEIEQNLRPEQSHPSQDQLRDPIHRDEFNTSSSSNNQNSRLSLSSNSSNCSNSSNNLNGICKICYTNSIELVFLPCGHSVSCISCAQRLHNCPFCRATITTRIRTFLV